MSKTKQTKAPQSRARQSPRASGLAAASAAMEEVARAEVSDARKVKLKTSKPKPKTRAGKKGLVLYVLPEVTLALRKLALEQGSDVQQLGWRALELLFAEYKTPLPASRTVVAKA